MKLSALALLSLAAGTQATHEYRAHHAKRQAPGSPNAPVSTITTAASTAHSSNAGPSAVNPSSTTGTGSAATNKPTPTGPPLYPIPPPQGNVPPLSKITSGMPSVATQPVPTTYKPGASAPIEGAPPLPTAFVFRQADWPPQDTIPDTNSPEVQAWMKELDGIDIPNYKPTVDGSCGGDPAAAADAQNRGWWTCGGWTRDTDVTACPDKYTWGVSFDDGPGFYTQQLLSYLDEKDIKATFFVVGSRVIERPNVLIEEYMGGNEISVHTWSHKHLTSLTNEQIVAELGWTRKAIKDVLGVTPTTMRPPFGDIDDRVRAISLAMGMVPVIWTRTPSAGQFDTNDWKVAGGVVTGIDSFNSFQGILGNASIIDTGFIVLQHDLYDITVELATGYTLNAAQTHNPPFTLKPIGQCMSIPSSDMYRESNTNKTFPAKPVSDDAVSGHNAGGGSSSASLNAAATGTLPGLAVLLSFTIVLVQALF
ncbi:hypothetical protein EWM64_g1731 [Hericium alpestre]|uniref:chitin deacetylase n=1 Tax=Hericium alpestre TaxID=135208 RepID=A0A4Z0A7N0_9AGAM|nr:hypothetical protein EWM64_g1731 [Hericium alpestre]